MKTDNTQPDGSRAGAIVHGLRKAKRSAGEILVRDSLGTEVLANEILFSGLTVTDDDDGTAIVSADFDNLGLLPMTPAQLTANTNNWDPVDATNSAITLDAVSLIRVSTDASRTLTGLVAPDPPTERMLVIANVGSNDLIIKHDVTSTAANRFYCPNSLDHTIARNSSVWIFYDTNTTAGSRWRVIGTSGTTGGLGQYTNAVRKTADQAVTNSSTLTNDTELLWTVAANDSWRFEIQIAYTTDATGDLKCDLAVSAGTMNAAYRYLGSDTTANAVLVSTGIKETSVANTIAIAAGGGSTAIVRHLLIEGYLFVTNTATVRFRFAQNTTTPGQSATVKAGSQILLKKLD